MSATQSYATRQREALGAYLRERAGQHVSAEDIIAHFAASAEPIGRATVYRYLRKLEQDGVVQRYVTDGREASCFQYIDESAEPEEHFHLKCERCGTLQHIQCHTLSDLGQHIKGEHGFEMNPFKTVLYGVCHDCRDDERIGENQ
jgi:Fur family ferric uptake transcriptional regulator